MATRKKSNPTLEPIKLEYKLRASRTHALLIAIHPQLQDTIHEEPLKAALELLERVPRAFNNAEAKACLAQVVRLAPSILGLTDPRQRPY